MANNGCKIKQELCSRSADCIKGIGVKINKVEMSQKNAIQLELLTSFTLILNCELL